MTSLVRDNMDDKWNRNSMRAYGLFRDYREGTLGCIPKSESYIDLESAKNGMYSN